MKNQFLSWSLILFFIGSIQAQKQIKIEGNSIFCPDDPIILQSKKGLGNFHWSTSLGNLDIITPTAFSTSIIPLETGNHEITFTSDVYFGNIVKDSGFDDWPSFSPEEATFETTYKLFSKENYYFSPGIFHVDTNIIEPAFQCYSPNYYSIINSNKDTIPRGHFLVADGKSDDLNSNSKSEFALKNYVWQISNAQVNSKTKYIFSMDVSNVGGGFNNSSFMVLINGSPISLTIDESIVDTIIDITTDCTWETIKGTWNSSNETAITLTIAEVGDFTGTEGGHDFAIDNIAFYKSITQETTTFNFKVYDDCSFNSFRDTTICEGNKLVTTINPENQLIINDDNVLINYDSLYKRHTFSFNDLGAYEINIEHKTFEDNLILDSHFDLWEDNGSSVAQSFNSTYQFSNDQTVNSAGKYMIGESINGNFQTDACPIPSFKLSPNIYGDSIYRQNILYAQPQSWVGLEQPRTAAYGANNYIWSQSFDVIKNKTYNISLDAASYAQNAAIMILINDSPIDLFVDNINKGTIVDISSLCEWNHITSTWVAENDENLTMKVSEVTKTGFGIGVTFDDILFYSSIIDETKTVTIDVVDCVITGVTNDLTNEISIYPNPSNNLLNISTNNFIEANIYSTEGLLQGSYFRKEISVEDFNNGVYILEIITNEGITSKQFIKD